MKKDREYCKPNQQEKQPSMAPSPTSLSFFFFFFFFFSLNSVTQAAQGGEWKLLKTNIGVSAMHMQLLNNDRVIIFDRTDYGPSKINLPEGKCRDDPNEQALKHDCTAHSVEYDVYTNSIRALTVQTDVWCSSGTVSPNGHLIQTGGFNDGERAVRIFQPCGSCDWNEIPQGLYARRWYATNQLLPDGRAIVIGGRQQFNYEFYPKSSSTNRLFPMPFLAETNDRGQENNLYPFVHLNVDGNLFVFANNRAILFDYTRDRIVRTFPTMPGGYPRSYPSSGSSVLLPLKNKKEEEAEVLICGGAPRGSYLEANGGNFMGALDTCGRIRITDPNPDWFMETMPHPRVMGDMTLLPDGNVLIINGAGRGTAGWELGRDPVFEPVIYRPDAPPGSRFEVQNPSNIPRLYHSTAILLRDGRVLVGGNNPHIRYQFNGVLFPTDLTLESFSPEYMFSNIRPRIIAPASQTQIGYGQKLVVRFSVPPGTAVRREAVSVTMVAPPFTTHAYSMNQRLLVMGGGNVAELTNSVYEVAVTAPTTAVLAPPGYYLVFVVHQYIPSEGIWVRIQ
ncbi:aldehyde oxidase GLOX-like [Macadamia integrifolia]|uniref:aldehyde oxidase GLOX-like n=1 Tax=Macadamia integrifolia TaxID=60698 RepID=UPI001C4F3456|nr:aldehyde oxidase GLOX-like [Macadamia integrifolia]